MSTEPFAQFEQHGPLTQVREGMDVYDQANNKVGTVSQVYMGNSDEMGIAPGEGPATAGSTGDDDDSFLEDLAEVFVSGNDLPEAFRGRLLREGYIQIDAAGIFTGDRFATPDQIAEVRGDRVALSVPSDDLIAH